MSRTIDPAKWRRYIELRDEGWWPTGAARLAGIGLTAAFAFERREPTSTGLPVLRQIEAEWAAEEAEREDEPTVEVRHDVHGSVEVERRS